jgi:hypothetical protein
VGAFYVPCAREGRQILQMKRFTSVSKIGGHSRPYELPYTASRLREGFTPVSHSSFMWPLRACVLFLTLIQNRLPFGQHGGQALGFDGFDVAVVVPGRCVN